MPADAGAGHRSGIAPSSPGAPPAASHIAYVMSRFPKLTETFVLDEILSMERAGVSVEIYPLLRERASIMHPEALRLTEQAHYLPFLSPSILAAQVRLLVRRPRVYLGTLWAVIRGTWGSANFLGGALAIFPKVAFAAERMRATGIAHVHCHFANHPAVAGFIIHRLTGIPFSFTAHGSDLHVDRRMLCEKVAEAAFVVPISEYNRQLIMTECGAGSADKLVVIHCGVDTELFQPPPSGRGTTPRLRIACIGTLHEVKGQRYLVEACRQLAAGGIEFECHIVGDGDDRVDLARQIRDSGLAGRVKLRGGLTRAEIAGLLHRTDVLVAPSVPTRSGKREGIPVVLMEAMATGLPVIASRISGIPELVDDGRSGILVPARDSTALAAALRSLHDDASLRLRLGNAGRAKVAREFDTRHTAAALRAQFPTVA